MILLRKSIRLLSLAAAVFAALVVTVAFPQRAYADTTYYYYTTDPYAGPLVINGITYWPCATLPSAGTQVQQVYPGQCVVPQYVAPTYPQYVAPQTPQYINGAAVPQPQTNNSNIVINAKNTGINAEAEKQTYDLRWYAVERGWNVNWKAVQDTDCLVKRTIEFSNRNGKFTVEQQTVLQSAGNYTTGWWWNGAQTSKEAIQQALSAYCAK